METTYKEWQESGEPESLGHGPYYTSHGTHVSGTIVASPDNQDSEFKTTGVAHDAEVYGYKVLGPYGTGNTENIMAAVEKSFKDGMDVINMSLGANFNEAINIENQSNEAKNLEISVEFLGTEHGGLDANQNNVKLEIPQTITLNSGESKKISPKIIIPQG